MTQDGRVDLDQMLDLATPWCLMVAATLRIPGLIAEGHHDIYDLATAAGCDPDALHAVLGHLVAKGVFLERAAHDPGRRRGHPGPGRQSRRPGQPLSAGQNQGLSSGRNAPGKAPFPISGCTVML